MSLPDYIFPGAFVRLRNGEKARIYATDGSKPCPIHGAILAEGEWHHRDWSPAGRYIESWSEHGRDIIGPWVDRPDCSKLWSILPPWIKWVAQDESGMWFGHSEEPQCHARVWMRGFASVIPAEYAPAFTGDWKDSLCERPTA